MSRVQLALDVSNIDEAVAFYTKLFGTERLSGAPATRTSRLPIRRSSLSCWKTPAMAAPSTTSASRSPTPTLSMLSRPAWPRRAWPRSMSATPRAVTPGRTSSGSRARRMGGPGRSTPSWPTARPSTAKARTAPPAVAARPGRPARPGNRPHPPRSAASRRSRRTARLVIARPGARRGLAWGCAGSGSSQPARRRSCHDASPDLTGSPGPLRTRADRHARVRGQRRGSARTARCDDPAQPGPRRSYRGRRLVPGRGLTSAPPPAGRVPHAPGRTP